MKPKKKADEPAAPLDAHQPFKHERNCYRCRDDGDGSPFVVVCVRRRCSMALRQFICCPHEHMHVGRAGVTGPRRRAWPAGIQRSCRPRHLGRRSYAQGRAPWPGAGVRAQLDPRPTASAVRPTRPGALQRMLKGKSTVAYDCVSRCQTPWTPVRGAVMQVHTTSLARPRRSDTLCVPTVVRRHFA